MELQKSNYNYHIKCNYAFLFYLDNINLILYLEVIAHEIHYNYIFIYCYRNNCIILIFFSNGILPILLTYSMHMCHVQNWLMWVKVGYIIENRIFSIIYYILLNKFKIIIHIKCIALYIT